MIDKNGINRARRGACAFSEQLLEKRVIRAVFALLLEAKAASLPLSSLQKKHSEKNLSLFIKFTCSSSSRFIRRLASWPGRVCSEMFGCSEELVAEQLERFSEGGRFLVSLPSSSPLELESESRETKLRTNKNRIITSQQFFGK